MVKKKELRVGTALVGVLAVMMGPRLVAAQTASFRAEGAVVAIQLEEGQIRQWWQPGSLGDLVEVFMVRVYQWPHKNKPRLIVIGYSHNDAVIPDKEFDSNVWRFDLREEPPSEWNACSKDWITLGHSVKTPFGAHLRLPKPETLPCYLMEKRPIAVGQSVKPRQRK
jgi:hypothetical protein